MAQFTPLISSLEYKPTSYEEYMQPYALQEALYQGRRKALDEKDEILAKYLPYINDSTPEAKRLYDSAQEQLNRNIEQLNDELPAYSRVSRMRMMHEEFEKTPKRSIKRYLYQH